MPELRKAQCPGSPVTGTAATAAPVSCDSPATTSMHARPVSFAISGSKVPSIVPEGTICGNLVSLTPNVSSFFQRYTILLEHTLHCFCFLEHLLIRPDNTFIVSSVWNPHMRHIRVSLH